MAGGLALSGRRSVGFCVFFFFLQHIRRRRRHHRRSVELSHASFFFGGEGADEVIFAARAGADAGVLDARVVVVADDARIFAGGPAAPRRCAGTIM